MLSIYCLHKKEFNKKSLMYVFFFYFSRIQIYSHSNEKKMFEFKFPYNLFPIKMFLLKLNELHNSFAAVRKTAEAHSWSEPEPEHGTARQNQIAQLKIAELINSKWIFELSSQPPV